MNRLIVAGICALLAFPALAAEEGSLADAVTPPAAEQSAAPAPAAQNAAEAPADVDMANVRAAQQAASGVPATGEGQGGAQPGGGQPGTDQTQPVEPKSSIPLDKRQGGDITKCLEAGDKSDKAIAACANQYRPKGHPR